MRKYYKQRHIANARGIIKGEGNLPWLLLEAMVDRLGTEVPEKLLTSIRDIVLRRDVKGLCKDLPGALFSEELLQLRENVPVFRDVYQIVCFLKKYPFSAAEFPHDRRSSAKEKLLACEEQCRATNERLLGTKFFPSWAHRARQIIDEVLGDLTPSLIMEMISGGSHGPGATLSNKGSKTTPYYKYAVYPYTYTKTAKLYAYAAISSNSRWMETLERSGRRQELPPLNGPRYQKELMLLEDISRVAEHDSITFVPKDAFTDRPIAVGASLNVYMQLGVKSYMQERLKKFGVDLSDQTRNQEFARLGSLYSDIDGCTNENQYATLDLASASDTLSFETVRWLLPGPWWAFLDDLRHKTGVVDGTVISYEKFCAMGNGFTFPLETLVFWAIAKAVGEEHGCNHGNDLSVYGDDIIVRKKVAPSVIIALGFFGFSVNSEKSFQEGPFKESCGCDFLHGINVRPFYLKRRLRTYADIYFLCNSVARMCMSNRGSPLLRALYSRALSEVPRDVRLYFPLGDNSDEGLIVPLSAMQTRALRPYLSKQEEFSLRCSGLLKEPTSNLPIAWFAREAPISYNGRSDIRLLTALESLEGRSPVLYGSKVSLSVGGAINRRKATKHAIGVRLVPNWDYPYTSVQDKHPIHWIFI